MSWDLRGGEKRPALNLDDVRRDGKEVLMVETVAVAGKTRTVEVERVRGVDLGGDSPFWIVRIPADFYVLLRETDVPDSEVRRIPLDWRMATREAFQGLFGRGFRVVDFVKVLGLRSLNAYLLRRT
jgi:predicted GNAT superfamily acetyltransferase